ncbi:hypothetical protein D3C87_1440130 [compost metagenome]
MCQDVGVVAIAGRQSNLVVKPKIRCYDVVRVKCLVELIQCLAHQGNIVVAASTGRQPCGLHLKAGSKLQHVDHVPQRGDGCRVDAQAMAIEAAQHEGTHPLSGFNQPGRL